MQLKDIKAVRSFINGIDDDLLVSFLQGMCEEAVAGAIEATKEKAAKVCEELAIDFPIGSSNCAAAIRSMK